MIVTIAVLGLRPKRYSRTVVTVAAAGLVFALAFTQLDKIPAVSNRVGNTDNFSSRLGSYKQGLEIFRSAPVFGVGATRYNDVASQLPIIQVNGINSLPRAHSSVINMLAECGVIGFVALLLAALGYGGVIRALNRYRGSPQDEMVSALLIGAGLSYLLYSLTLTMLPYAPPNAFLAVLLGLAAGRLDWHAGQRAGRPLR
jgi:O-antigen ligase